MIWLALVKKHQQRLIKYDLSDSINELYSNVLLIIATDSRSRQIMMYGIDDHADTVYSCAINEGVEKEIAKSAADLLQQSWITTLDDACVAI